MYIELYLLENLLMDLLLLRAAGALLGRRCFFRRLFPFSAFGAFYGLLTLVYPFFGRLLPRLAAGFFMSLALLEKEERGRSETCFSAFFALLGSCFLLGGLSFCLQLLTEETKGLSLWAALFLGLAASFLPNPLRSLLRRPAGETVSVRILEDGKSITLPAMVDTGNLLYEPLSGLPVAVAFLPEFRDKAHIPVRVKTVNGERLLLAFRPRQILYGEIPMDLLVALSPEAMDRMILPPGAIPMQKREVHFSCSTPSEICSTGSIFDCFGRRAFTTQTAAKHCRRPCPGRRNRN